MNFAGHPLGVCSWSLHPSGMADLVQKLRKLELQHVHLALSGLVQLDDKRKAQELSHLRGTGIQPTAAMISFPGEDYSTIENIRRTGGFVPDDLWPIRRALSRECARLAVELGTKMVSTHIGFVPRASEPGYQKIVDRTRAVTDDFAASGADLLMESGPEPAEEMREFIGKVGAANLFVNFDPANMILYGGADPIEAVRILGSHIRHVHLKDAKVSPSPGTEWGTEVPFGDGEVGPGPFFKALQDIHYAGPLVIEREGGESRMEDVRKAIGVCLAVIAARGR